LRHSPYWRDSDFQVDPSDTDEDRVRLIVKTARAANPSLRILISLGWGEETNDAGHAASTPEPFADSVCALVERYNLDGFDIDFESTTAEPAKMLQLAQRVRQGLDDFAPK
jgi:GH18 family chitinase